MNQLNSSPKIETKKFTHPGLRRKIQEIIPLELLKNPEFSFPIRILLFILGISFIAIGISFTKLPPLIPLYYSLPWGEEQLARTIDLFIIPLSVTLLFLFNLLFSLVFLKNDKFLIKLLMWSSTICSILGLITLIKIIFLVN